MGLYDLCRNYRITGILGKESGLERKMSQIVGNDRCAEPKARKKVTPKIPMEQIEPSINCGVELCRVRSRTTKLGRLGGESTPIMIALAQQEDPTGKKVIQITTQLAPVLPHIAHTIISRFEELRQVRTYLR